MTIAQQTYEQPVKHMRLSNDHMPDLFPEIINELPGVRDAFIKLPDIFSGFKHSYIFSSGHVENHAGFDFSVANFGKNTGLMNVILLNFMFNLLKLACRSGFSTKTLSNFIKTLLYEKTPMGTAGPDTGFLSFL